MTADSLIAFLVIAFFVLIPLIRIVRGMKRGYDRLVEQQKGQTAPDRVAKIEAMMAARGITPPPALQAAIAAYEAAPAYQAPPAAAQQRYQAQRPAQQPASTVRRAVPAARSIDVPSAPLAPAGSMRRTLADAFGDPAHARNAVVLAEVLGSPVALR